MSFLGGLAFVITCAIVAVIAYACGFEDGVHSELQEQFKDAVAAQEDYLRQLGRLEERE